MPQDDLRDQFEREMERVRENSFLSPEYRRKKVITWLIRTLFAAAIYYFLWEYKWVRWTLLIYVPINLIGILSVFGMNYILSRKIEHTGIKIEEADFEVVDTDYTAIDTEDGEAEDAEFTVVEDDE